MVHDDRIYAIPSDENHHIPNRASSEYHTTGVSGALQQQWSLEEIYNRDGYLTSGGSQPNSFYWRETTEPTWWSQRSPWVVMTLAAMMILPFLLLLQNIAAVE